MRQLDAKRNSFLLQFLQDANLNGADPNTRSLYNTPDIIDFHGVVLRDVDLREAAVSYADLSGADLGGAHNLTQQQLDRVYSCKGATLPHGLTCHNNP